MSVTKKIGSGDYNIQTSANSNINITTNTLSVIGTVSAGTLSANSFTYANGAPFSGGGGGAPGGVSGQFQYNNSGSFGGAAKFNYSANGQVLANASISSTSTTTGTMVIVGGIGTTGNLYISGVGQLAGGLQSTPIGNVTPSSALFTSVGASSNVTAAAMTSNGSITAVTTLQALGGVQATPIGNVTASSGKFTTIETTSTATVNSLQANADSTFNSNLTVLGNLVVSGNVITSGSNNVSFTDSIIELHTQANLAPLTYDDGKDIGIRFHYFKGADNNAALVWENSDQVLYWFGGNVTETGSNIANGILGTFKTGQVLVGNSTPTTGNATGALQVSGGISSGGNVYAVGNITGNYLFGNGSQLTGLSATYSNANVASYLPTYSGNLTAGNILSNNYLYANGINILAGISGNYANANVASYLASNSSITILTTGNITGNGLTSNGSMVTTGPGQHLGGLQATPVGNATASTGQFTTLSATGNITANALSVNLSATIGSTLQALGGIQATPIGNGTASSGAFTSVSASTTINGPHNGTLGSAGGNTAIVSTLTATGNATVSALSVNNSATVGTTLGVTGNAIVGNILASGFYFANGAAFTGASGNGSPGGSTGQIQYYTGSGFGGVSGFTYSGGTLTATSGLQNTPIGNATASTGNFTTLTATSFTITGGLQNTPVGNATPNTGQFTTVTAGTLNAATIGNTGATLTGTLQTSSQPSITQVGTLANLTLGGTLNGTTVQAATIGNTNATHIGNGAALTSLTGANVTGTVSLATTSTYVTGLTAANVTAALGSTAVNNATTSTYVTGLTAANVTAALGSTAVNNATTSTYVTGLTSANVTTALSYTPVNRAGDTNISGALTPNANATINLGGTSAYWATGYFNAIQAPSITGVQQVAAQPNITSVGTLTGLGLSGNLNISTGTPVAGNTSGSIITGRLLGRFANASGDSRFYFFDYNGTNDLTASDALAVQKLASKNDSSMATASISMAVGTNYGNTAAGLAFVSGTASDVLKAALGSGAPLYTGNVNAVLLGYPSLGPRILVQNYALGDDSPNVITYIGTTHKFIGNIIADSVGSNASTLLSGTLQNEDQPNITNVGSLTGLTLSGDAQPYANTSVNLGTNSLWWNNVYAVSFKGISTTAQYADLAENYSSDAEYTPGTVLVFGGTAEVTQSTQLADNRVAGVVSTNPAYLMNSALTSGVSVALVGRVPCNVIGTIRQGDMLVTSDIPGVATYAGTPAMGTVIGKALQNYNSTEVGTIEIAVGRL